MRVFGVQQPSEGKPQIQKRDQEQHPPGERSAVGRFRPARSMAACLLMISVRR
jgi:hypothetical protein